MRIELEKNVIIWGFLKKYIPKLRLYTIRCGSNKKNFIIRVVPKGILTEAKIIQVWDATFFDI